MLLLLIINIIITIILIFFFKGPPLGFVQSPDLARTVAPIHILLYTVYRLYEIVKYVYFYLYSSVYLSTIVMNKIFWFNYSLVKQTNKQTNKL